MQILRQGDVIIRPSKIPNNVIQTHNMVLAEGEATGHTHRLTTGEVEVYQMAATAVLYLRVLSEFATLFHEEHDSLYIPRGEHEVNRQRTWDWFSEEVKKVVD